MANAQEYRDYVHYRIVAPAKNRGDKNITVSAREIAANTNGDHQYPNIYQAITGCIFKTQAGVSVEPKPNRAGSKTKFVITW